MCGYKHDKIITEFTASNWLLVSMKDKISKPLEERVKHFR